MIELALASSLLELEECVQKLTLNLFSSCSMTWSVVILLEMRTLVGVPKDGVKMEVCGGQWEIGERQSGWKCWIKRGEGRAEIYLIIVEVSVDGEAMLSFFLPLCCWLAPPPPPLDQWGVAHAAKQVGLRLQLGALLPRGTQRGGLINNRAFRSCAETHA